VAPPIPERNFDDEDDGELENVEADGQGQEEGEPPAEAPGEEASPEAVQVMWFGESTPFDLTLFSVLFCYSGLHYLQNVTETRWLCFPALWENGRLCKSPPLYIRFYVVMVSPQALACSADQVLKSDACLYFDNSAVQPSVRSRGLTLSKHALWQSLK